MYTLYGDIKMVDYIDIKKLYYHAIRDIQDDIESEEHGGPFDDEWNNNLKEKICIRDGLQKIMNDIEFVRERQ